MSTKDNIEYFHDYNIHIPSRTMFIGGKVEDGGVDNLMAETAVKNIHLLSELSKDEITILMQNPGGDCYSGFAIYDAIRTSPCHVTIKAFGEIMSAGSFIFQAADTRIMAPNCVQMIHYGTFNIDAHAKDAQRWAKEAERIDGWMEQVYLQRMKQKYPKIKLKDVQNLLQFDTFLTAKQSVEVGLCDKIL